VESVLNFDSALETFRAVVAELFAAYAMPEWPDRAFFPSQIRTPILEAGRDMRLVRLSYDGLSRIVEPYSLVFKRRRDGHAEEYLYVYDRTGGRSSGPGIKALVNQKIRHVEVLAEKFQPRYFVELAKAGEFGNRTHFGRPFSRTDQASWNRLASLRRGWRYTVQCSFCNRQFKRMRRDTILRPHKDGYGNDCLGRWGVIVDQQFV
jgi:hypothetical protein